MSPEQIMLVGLLASAITFVLKILATYVNWRPGRLLVNIGLYVVAGGLAVLWTHPALPPFSDDIGAYVAALFQLAAPVVGFATLVYNALYSQVVVPAFKRFARQ